MPTTMGVEPEILDIGPTPSGSRRGMVLVLVVVAVIAAAVGGYFVGSKQGTRSPSSSTRITSAATASRSSTGANAFEHPKLVTGTVSCGESNSVEYTSSIGSHLRNGSGGHCVMTSNDPRVAGTDSFTYNADRWFETSSSAGFPHEMGIQWGTSRLTNAGGAWVGRFTGVSDTGSRGTVTWWYTGTGGYAGLGYVMWIAPPSSGGPNSGPTNGSAQGLIFAGNPPTL